MKKQFTILLILVFILGLAPVNFSEAITQNQIDAEVQIVCTDGAGSWFSGSGTIIDPKGIILTNRHVIEGAYKNTCFIGFIRSISQEPDFGTEGNYNLAEVKYYTTTDDMDAAILYLDNPVNKNYTYVNIWDANSDSLKFGDKVEAIGFPSIGGSTVTYTSGDFSGFGSSFNGTTNYIKTTIPLEYGNSGGAAYNSSNQFIGIPTMAIIGDINSLSYILSINSIKSWLYSFLGDKYENEIVQNQLITTDNEIVIQNDIAPPSFNEVSHEYFRVIGYDEDSINLDNFNNPNRIDYAPSKKLVSGYFNKIKLATYNYTFNVMEKESKITSTYYSYSKNLSDLNEKNEYKYNLDYTAFTPENNHWESPNITPYLDLRDGYGTYYIGVRFQDSSGNISERFIFQYEYQKASNSENQQKDEEESESQIDSALANRLSGQILLQVEKNGEAYYIYPGDKKRYYLGRPTDAFNVMRELGLGATHDFITGHTIYPTNVLGKILIDVEDKGKAYYIYPKDKKAYYLGWPADAFRIMRELGLGITNDDLNKIPEGSL